MIPKIIHQTGPSSKSNWHPVWEICQKSWKDNHKDFKYMFWNDEDIDNLVKDSYPQYYEDYIKFPLHIIKIDFARFCMLHKYGGIYADLDMFCYSNFYDELDRDIALLGALSPDEIIQNSMMVSSAGNEFYIKCMELSIQENRNLIKTIDATNKQNVNDLRSDSYAVRTIAGPILLSNLYNIYNKDEIQILPRKFYNEHPLSYSTEYRTKHLLTGMWGNDDCSEKDIDGISFNFFMKNGVFPEIFDPYINYQEFV